MKKVTEFIDNSQILNEDVNIIDPTLAQQYSQLQKQMLDKDNQINALRKQINTVESAKVEIQKMMVAIEQQAAKIAPVQPTTPPAVTTQPTTNVTPSVAKSVTVASPQQGGVVSESYNQKNINLLKIAIDRNSYELLDDAINEGSDVNADDNYALRNIKYERPASIKMFKRLLEDKNIDVNFEDGWLLRYFVTHNKPEYVDILVNYSSYKLPSNLTFWMDWALEYGYDEIFNILSKKSKVNESAINETLLYESVQIWDKRDVSNKDLEQLIKYMAAENIEYDLEEDTIEFDIDDLDSEWSDRLEDMGFKESWKEADELYLDDENIGDSDLEYIDLEEPELDDKKFTDINGDIEEAGVFYVKIKNKGETLIGKIFKLDDESDWSSKIVVGELSSFDKFEFDKDWDEIDIIAFLRDNYDSAEVITKQKYEEYL
jgi:cell division septum initiation protein DivIVA